LLNIIQKINFSELQIDPVIIMKSIIDDVAYQKVIINEPKDKLDREISFNSK
jgi:hypothetical protein